jgi:hypothetical protein
MIARFGPREKTVNDSRLAPCDVESPVDIVRQRTGLKILPQRGSCGILWRKPAIGEKIRAQIDSCLKLATARLRIAH